MLKTLKVKLINYWKDPVWSKIIAAIIISIITIIYNLVKSYFSDTDFLTEFNKFWNLQIRLWLIFLILLIIYSIYFLFNSKSNSINFIYDNETLQMDRNLFNRIRNELFTSETFYNLK